MHYQLKITFNFFLLIGVTVSSPQKLPYEVVFGWKEVDFAFKSPAEREAQINGGDFIPENNIITGIKVQGNRVFLTVPRWRPGIPSTLNYVPLNATTNSTGPKLIPYPSWEWNEEGNCSRIQYVQSMEIDQFGRMWVVDVGRRDIFGENPDNSCAPKLLLIDLVKDEVVRSFEFPGEVVSRNSSFLNDLVVGCTSPDECLAYITDARDAKIVAFDLARNTSWYVEHNSMQADPNSLVINIQGVNYTFDTAADGIALSNRKSNFSTLYYCPLSSYNVYSVRTEVIRDIGRRNVSGSALRDAEVSLVGRKSSQTDGMTIDSHGILYYGLLGDSGISAWDTRDRNMTEGNQEIIAQSDIDLQWPDTFSISEDGYLYATPNRLHRFSTNTYNFSDINYRVVRLFINASSYMLDN